MFIRTLNITYIALLTNINFVAFDATAELPREMRLINPSKYKGSEHRYGQLLVDQGDELNPKYYNLGQQIQNSKEDDFDGLTNDVDWRYWRREDFDYGGWCKMDNLGVRINKTYIDSMINPQGPHSPGMEMKRYYLVVDISLRALDGTQKVAPSGDFGIKDEQRVSSNQRAMRTTDYEGRTVNGNFKLGMYERLNPGKLKSAINITAGPDDEVTVGAARATAIMRKIPFAVGEDDVFGPGRRFLPYVKGIIYFCYGSSQIQITNLDWQERYYNK